MMYRECVILLSLAATVSCGGNQTSMVSVSQAGGTLSHNSGANCMSCHNPSGGARSWFTAAGTLMLADGSIQTGDTVKLSNMTGTVVVNLEVDSLGNFFTTEDIGLPEDPIVPSILDAATGKLNIMPFSTPSAACNFCHVESNRFKLQ